MNNVGVVVIGRNEGDRLKSCIKSLAIFELKIIYVDSNSTDDSVEFVTSQGFDAVELDMSIPFSAARARNEGYQYLLSHYGDIEYIQFVDGDCIVDQEWMPRAYQHLLDNPQLAAICGRRRERFPQATIYNALCDIEWDSPVGIVKATGGDFLCRAQALKDVNGFSPQVIAGEEPELGFRMREKGWKIERLDCDMTWHDANITQLSQWWKRHERGGHAYAHVCYLHGKKPEHYRVKDVAKILLWGLLVPLVIVVFTLLFGKAMLLLALVYPLKIVQIFFRNYRAMGVKLSLAYSASIVMEKFPQLKGVVGFYIKACLGKTFNIIEYKN